MKCWMPPFMVMMLCVFSLSITMITSVGCGPLPDEASDVSELHSVYDQKYGVRLTLDNSTQLYRFQACLLEEKGSFDEESCVDALRSSEGTSVTFAVKDLDELSLTKEEKKKLDRALEDWRPYILAMGKRKTGIALALASGIGGGVVALDEWYGKRNILLKDFSFLQDQLDEKKALLEKLEAGAALQKSSVSQTFTPQKEVKGALLSDDFLQYFMRNHPDAKLQGFSGDVVGSSVNLKTIVKGFVAQGYKPTDIIHPDFIDGLIQASSFVKNGEELAQVILTDPQRTLRELNAYARILARASALKALKVAKVVDEAQALVTPVLKKLRQVSTRIGLGVVAVGSAVLAFVAFSNHGTSEAVAVVDGLKEKNQELLEVLTPSAALLTTNAEDRVELDHLSVKNVLEHLASHVSSLADSPSQMVPWYCLPQGGGGEKCWSSQKLTSSLSASFGG